MAIPEQLGMSLTGQGDLKGQDSHITLSPVLKADRGSPGACRAAEESEARSWRHQAGTTVETLLGEGLLRTAVSLCSSLVLRVKSDSTHHGCGLEGVGGHWLLSVLALW